jgi:hypothetical protein
MAAMMILYRQTYVKEIKLDNADISIYWIYYTVYVSTVKEAVSRQKYRYSNRAGCMKTDIIKEIQMTALSRTSYI